MNTNKILIADVRKKAKIENNETWYAHLFVSFNRDKLKAEIEKHYNIKLKKNKEDEFPYFTDGGFKYTGENRDWFFEVTAFWYETIN